MKENKYDIILIGGSAGSIPLCTALLKSLKKERAIPVVVIIHRMRNVDSELEKLLARESGLKKIIEPEDKQPLSEGKVYLAPQNYHLLFEEDRSFSLDYSDAVHYSRPSIDVSFESAAQVFGKKILAILLSGANADGAKGIAVLSSIGADCWIQDPATAESATMPAAAIAAAKGVSILPVEKMQERISEL